jgi:hypothetical protein
MPKNVGALQVSLHSDVPGLYPAVLINVNAPLFGRYAPVQRSTNPGCWIFEESPHPAKAYA